MPTRPVESTHDKVRDSEDDSQANAQAEPDREVPERRAAGVESPSADRMRGANGLPHEGNADDHSSGDQDIDTAGTAHDDLSPTKSL